MGGFLLVRHDKRLRELAVGLFKQGCGRRYAARQLGVSESVVRKWRNAYISSGSEVVLSMGKKKLSYSYETKLAAVEAVVDGGMAKVEAMGSFGIVSTTSLEKWCKAYREGGADALRPKPKGRPSGSKAKPRETTREEELEARVRCLEAENAYLKKLAALKAEKRLRAGRNPES